MNNPHVEDIKAIDFVNLQNTLMELGKKPGTNNRICQTLKTILNVCRRMEVIDKIPYWSPLKEPPGRDVIFTEQEEQDLYRAALRLNGNGQLMHDIIRFAFLTGCRQGELIKLKWSDVDFVRGRLTFFATKTGQHRVLPLQGDLLELMKRLHHDAIDEQVFPIWKDKLIYWWMKTKEIAGITERDKVFHSIRHTVCSRLWQRGVSQPDIMRVMGHSNAETTQRYSHHSEEGVANALALL